ncbi:MAG: hypothetical protein LBG96_09865 [Tannerella sp.]|jgi:hypothetical protein|nr:hypothetical protein [Tannerella sp.]
MEQKNKITSLQELIEWVDSRERCYVSEQDDDYFCIEAPNNADISVNIEEDDTIEDIVARTIEHLRDFEADERFTEWWSADFAKHNGFSPSQFLRMLQEDEASFRELADNLEETR